MSTKRAETVEVGDTIVTTAGRHVRVSGSFVDGSGRIRLEYDGRWNLHSRGERIHLPDRPLKQEVASIFKAEMERVRGHVAELGGVVDCEYQDVSNLIVQLRVKTQSDGTHYFVFRMSEAW